MPIVKRIRLVSCIALTLALFTGAAFCRNAPEKGHIVDAGAFGVFVNGQRVATETFQVQQGAAVNTASSEFKLEGAETKTSHRAELQITAAGDLRRYEWRELSPGKASLVVEPKEQFLIEHLSPNPPNPPAEQPFMVPLSTMVLDDYVFSQRELLAWRYLAQACNGNLDQCRPGRTQFGVLVPQQRTTALVTLEYAGPEKVFVRGIARGLNRVNMKVDDADWVLYLDADLKLVKITIASEHTEVVRD